MAVECAHCGQGFERKAWIAEKQERLGRAQYCSVECRDKAKRGRKGELRVERIIRDCPTCGGPFVIAPHERRRKYCSRSCAGQTGGRRASRGTRFLNGDGYVFVYLPPAERPLGHEKTPHQPEHRVVMAKVLGRWPEPNESVHHINGDKTDNRPENLQLRSGSHGRGQVLRCRGCGSSDIEAVEL